MPRNESKGDLLRVVVPAEELEAPPNIGAAEMQSIGDTLREIGFDLVHANFVVTKEGDDFVFEQEKTA